MGLHLAATDPAVSEWLNLILRWAHIVAGIAWIGHSFFFLWLDRATSPPGRTGGENSSGAGLWLAHGDGFYRVERVLAAPQRMPAALHWFKWEAFFTWLSGVFLLGVVYVLGGFLVVPGSGAADAGKAAAIGLATLPAAWLVYDVLWRSPLARSVPLASLVSLALAALLAYGLSRAMTGRSGYIHLGAVLGTLMAGNVWFRIIPAQQRLVAAMKAGREPDAVSGKSARVRLAHNDAMTFPVIFIMISNHFPTATRGYHWLMLVAVSLAGAGVRHLMNVRRVSAGLAAALGVALVVGTGYALRPEAPEGGKRPPRDASLPLYTVLPEKAGRIRGVVLFRGVPPQNPALNMSADPWCAARHGEAPRLDAVLVQDGKVQNAVVHVKEGIEGFSFEPCKKEVEINQVDCVFRPRVSAIQTGQPVAFVNLDDTHHNVHVFSLFNSGFNIDQPARGMRQTWVFHQPEIAIQVRCDIHPWMAARIAVLDHPFFSVTDEDGTFSLEGLAPGDYEIEAWHEVLGRRTVQVTLGSGEKKEGIEIVIEGP
ncbi:MAG: urate hydroxylase PuuD [Planctomycetes bacterium]|nr:urate hydroxylase PuuD [Planctomycetota bacterium]